MADKNHDNLIDAEKRFSSDNPKKEAPRGDALGEAPSPIKDTIDNALLPLAGTGHAVEMARDYFSGPFQREMAERAAKIPPQDLMRPKAYIAGPALQALAFAHEEPELKQLYLSLLATAIDRKHAASAHPAFVDILRQLDPEESDLLGLFVRSKNPVPCARVLLLDGEDSTGRELVRHLISAGSQKTGKPVTNPLFQSWIDNWVRLRLVDVQYGSALRDRSRYRWVAGRPEVQELRRQYPSDRLVLQRGSIKPTAFGLHFARAVKLMED